MDLEDRIQYKFKETALLQEALTHKSFHNENRKISDKDNECLEFLGDAVLSLSLSTLLINKFPDCNEGELSKMRASLVNEVSLCEMAKIIDLPKNLRLGQGEVNSEGYKKPRLLCSAFEALIGAIYSDSNFKVCHDIIERVFSSFLDSIDTTSVGFDDYKTKLQEKLQESIRLTPVYKVFKEQGPDHNKEFSIAVYARDQVIGRGFGRSKKQAEQSAAQEALRDLL